MLLLVHGGAGNRKPSKRALKILSGSLSEGYKVLRFGGSALDAVVVSVTVLEDSGLFNAGAGGNLQWDGIRRLDASLMEGRHLRAGSVVGLEGIRNPVRAARLTMDLPHVMLTNTGARRVAEKEGLDFLDEPGRLLLKRLEDIKKNEREMAETYERFFSTVGAVALDMNGDLAAGSSTGGVAAMLPGRVGDTPVIGAGIYAENSCGAVSCTGKGENIIRLSMAKEICMNLTGMTLFRAVKKSMKRLMCIGGEGGVIVINSRRQFLLAHTTEYMASGYADRRGIVVKEGFRRIR